MEILVSSQDRKLQRLLLLSQKEQWHIDDLVWDSLSFDDMPIYFQRHLATVFSHLLYGEQVALRCVKRLHDELTNPVQQELCKIQMKDERRHVAFFTTLLKNLHQPFELRDSLQKLLTDIYQAPTTETLLVGIHIVIENIAHTLFQSAQDVIQNTKVSQPNASIKSLQRITTNWIPNYLLIDESRHLAIGHILLQERLSKISPVQKAQLETVITRWGNLLFDMVIDPDMLRNIGLNEPKHAIQCLKDVNLRLRQLDIDVQLPIPPSISI